MTHTSAVARRMVSHLTLAALVISASAFAQTPIGPRPLPPPSYGAPPSPALVGYQVSQFSPQGFIFNIEVSLEQIKAFLPAGYTPAPSAAGATTATVTAVVGYQNLLTLQSPVGDFAPGTYGPFDSLDLVVPAFTPPGSPQPLEVVWLARFVNNSEIVDLRTALLGAGATQLADIDLHVQETGGEMRIKARVRDFDFGLWLAASVIAPAEIAAQVRNRGPLPARSMNSLVSPPTPAAGGLTAVSSDSAPASEPAAFELFGAIRLSGGRLHMLAVHPATVYWNNETFNKVN
jgi:hypothetical protein